MREKPRILLFLLSAGCFGTFLLWGLGGLPRFGVYQGPYGNVITRSVQQERHCVQSVAAVTFDYRGFDTLGEEFILFTAVTGALLLLRERTEEGERIPREEATDRRITRVSEAAEFAGITLFPFAFMMGLYVILHGHLTPGGGFQGGVLAASAYLYIYLGGRYENLEKLLSKPWMETLEAIGAGGYAVMGLVGLVMHGVFLQNVLPYGTKGHLLSAGMIPLLNLTVGLEVCAGFLLLVSAFLKQVLTIRKQRGR